MFNTQLTPRGPLVINRPAPTRPQPAAVYGQRGAEFARIIRTAR